MTQELTWRIGGQAGFGIKAAGGVFARSMARGGLSVFDYVEYPSLIRGGHNAFTARVSDAPILANVRSVDVLVALNSETVDRHLGDVVAQGTVVYDPAQVEIGDEVKAQVGARSIRWCPVPLVELATADGGMKLMMNTVAIGTTLGLVDYPFELLEGVLADEFKRKGDAVVASNVAAARRGFDHAREHCAGDFPYRIKPVEGAPKRILVDGNESVGLGALAAGCRFYAAYPMTPASSLLHFMAAAENDFGVVVKHTEDEIAAMNMTIGAATMGARAMCATSGGGFSLMVEGLGLAGVSETPIVVGLFSRPGPATGLPTWTEQGDLRFAIHAAQGEFPRIVISPGDKEEAFCLAADAFNLAEELQTPVIILSDMFMQESHQTVEPFDHEAIEIRRGKLLAQTDIDAMPRSEDGTAAYFLYSLGEGVDAPARRARPWADGVSPRALPGTRGVVGIRNSYEHDEMGWATEDAAMRAAQDSKRMAKLEAAAGVVPAPRHYGPDEAEVTILSWGSTKGPIREAMRRLEETGVAVSFLQVVTLWPFPADQVADVMRAAKRTLVIEENLTGQFEGLIRERCLLAPDHSLRKWDGRPFFPEEIEAKVREVLA
jgi:2-oxoglutarate ferredoxin oxidoreductase subunit alpha